MENKIVNIVMLCASENVLFNESPIRAVEKFLKKSADEHSVEYSAFGGGGEKIIVKSLPTFEKQANCGQVSTGSHFIRFISMEVKTEKTYTTLEL